MLAASFSTSPSDSCFTKSGGPQSESVRSGDHPPPTPMPCCLLGDLAVAWTRNDNVAMHRADYQLRDVSKPLRELVSASQSSPGCVHDLGRFTITSTNGLFEWHSSQVSLLKTAIHLRQALGEEMEQTHRGSPARK